jgi:ribosomal protein L11 methyltransferase
MQAIGAGRGGRGAARLYVTAAWIGGKVVVSMPYRVDLRDVTVAGGVDPLDRLVELGALDVEGVRERVFAALMPDSVAPEEVAGALGVAEVAVSPAAGRDADSVWVLSPRPVRAGRLLIVPAHLDAEPGALRLIDGPAFGTGLHPTTALCLEALDEAVQADVPAAVLDVGTGSGVLALAALMMGVPRATGVDIDEASLTVAGENARLNALRDRVRLARGGPDAADGAWPLVVANVLAASLIEMAPVLVRRVGHQGRLVLSGIPVSVEPEVAAAYRRLGMRLVDVKSRAGWVALVLRASW